MLLYHPLYVVVILLLNIIYFTISKIQSLMVIKTMELNSKKDISAKNVFHEVISSQIVSGKTLSVERIGDDYSIYEVDSSGFERSLFSSNTLSDVIRKYEEMIEKTKL